MPDPSAIEVDQLFGLAAALSNLSAGDLGRLELTGGAADADADVFASSAAAVSHLDFILAFASTQAEAADITAFLAIPEVRVALYDVRAMLADPAVVAALDSPSFSSSLGFGFLDRLFEAIDLMSSALVDVVQGVQHFVNAATVAGGFILAAVVLLVSAAVGVQSLCFAEPGACPAVVAFTLFGWVQLVEWMAQQSVDYVEPYVLSEFNQGLAEFTGAANKAAQAAQLLGQGVQEEEEKCHFYYYWENYTLWYDQDPRCPVQL